MTEFARYRGTSELPRLDVVRIARQIVRETSELSGRDAGRLNHLVEESAAAVDGYDASEDPAGAGYWQIMGTFAGTLLRVAGANADAAIAEVAKRDSTALELLARALLGRLAQLAERGEPTHLTTATGRVSPVVGTQPSLMQPGGPPVVPDSSRLGPASAMASVPGMASPYLGPARTPVSPPVAFLLGLIDESIERQIRGFDPRRFGGVGVSPPVGAPDAFDERDISAVHSVGARQDLSEDVDPAPVTISVGDGVSLVIRHDQVGALREPAQRAALLRSVAAGVERLVGGERPGRSAT